MKKKNIFLRALLIYCLVLAILIGGGLFVLNRFLVSYEASRPDNAVESFMSEKDRSFWLGGLQELIDRGFNEFTKSGAAVSEFGIDENGEITWRSAGGDDNSKVYDVRLGKAKICTLTLSPNEAVGFGMNNWVVSETQFQMPGGTDISLSVPTGCVATINGVEVASSYISGVGTIGVELEHDFDLAPDSEIYEIKGMMGPADIKAYDAHGKELEPVFLSENEIEFHPEPAYNFSFYTLPGAEVTVNDIDISGECCSSIGDELGVELLRYECEGLYTEPKISVLTDGNSFAPGRLNIGSCFIPDASPVIEGDMAEFLEGFIYAYVDFSANKNHAADANFAVFAQYLLPGSEFYTLTANTIENIAWATTSGLKYNSIDYYDLIPLGNSRYICNIYYDISYTLGSDDLHVQSGNTIVIEEHDGKYYVADMGAELKG